MRIKPNGTAINERKLGQRAKFSLLRCYATGGEDTRSHDQVGDRERRDLLAVECDGHRIAGFVVGAKVLYAGGFAVVSRSLYTSICRSTRLMIQ